MKETRKKLAKHFKALGKLDHPHVKEFEKEADDGSSKSPIRGRTRFKK